MATGGNSMCDLDMIVWKVFWIELSVVSICVCVGTQSLAHRAPRIGDKDNHEKVADVIEPPSESRQS
eukprot:4303313-Amphidinium_carterae.2